MQGSVETIVNRNRSSSGLPPGPWVPLSLTGILYALLAALYLFAPWPGAVWVGWAFLALAVAYPVAAWGASIVSVEIGPDILKVHRHSRSQALPMRDMLDVEAHHHWQSPFAKNRAPPYWLKIRRSSGRAWRLEYIDPAAGDRLLAVLHRFQKPILVCNGQ